MEKVRKTFYKDDFRNDKLYVWEGLLDDCNAPANTETIDLYVEFIAAYDE